MKKRCNHDGCPNNECRQGAQGDVLYTPVLSLPADATPVQRDGGRIVLAYGETTGHAHAILDRDVTLYQTEDARRFLEIRRAAATLVHEEHAPHTLQPGLYEIGSRGIATQRQYTPEAIIPVRD